MKYLRPFRNFGAPAAQTSSTRRAQFEHLEARLVLAVSLNSGPVSDDVVLFPDAQVGRYQIAADPQDAFGIPIVDLSHATAADQRRTISQEGTLVRIDVDQQYTLTARSYLVAQEIESLLRLDALDVDKRLIEALHVTKYAFATDTTLAAPLLPGAKSILISDATGWSNDPWEAPETRALAWYGYTDSTGHTYPDYTYTRNVAVNRDHGLWKPGAIKYDQLAGAYRIALRDPWTGPALPAGAAVRNAATQAQANELQGVQPGWDPYNSEYLWDEFAVTVGGGVWQNGVPDPATFRPGTAYLRPNFGQTATDVVVGHTEDFAFGATSDPARAKVAAVGNGRINLELDVLGKRALLELADGSMSDFDGDGDRDGRDFLRWQRGFGTTYDAADLQDWQQNYSARGKAVIDSIDSVQFGSASIGTDSTGKGVIRYVSSPFFLGTDTVHYTLRNTTTNETYRGSISVEVLGGNERRSSSVLATLANQAQNPVDDEAPYKRYGDIQFRTIPGIPLVGNGVQEPNLLSLFDNPNELLVVRLVDGPNHGALSLNYDGTFQYIADVGYAGFDTFKYSVFDGLRETSAVAEFRVLESPEAISEYRLQRLASMMEGYVNENGRFPVANGFDDQGNPYLSWRVHVLTRDIHYQDLYNQFHFDEPWNSPHNLALASKMPDIYRSVGDAANSTTTRYQTFTGPDAPFGNRAAGEDQLGPRYGDFRDGLDHTILIAESSTAQAVPWTKPDDLEFDASNPLAALGTIDGDIHTVTGDGKILTLPSTIDPQVFSALVTIDGDEVVDAHALRRQYAESQGSDAFERFAEESQTAYLRHVAIAMHNYADRHSERFPIGSSNSSLFDENGTPYVSWRVHILPELGYRNLYDQFHLDEPWDSPNNLPLLSQMPDLFRSASDSSGTTTTRIMTLNGPDAAFGSAPAGSDQLGPRFSSITDGTSNTIMFVEAGADVAVPWTKPDDLPFDVNNPLAALGTLTGDSFNVAMFDARVRVVPTSITAAQFAALSTDNASSTYNQSAMPSEEFAPTAVLDRFARQSGQLPSQQAQLNKFKELSLGMHNYADRFGDRFPADRFASDGTPLLSWRVLLLLELDYNLYKQFRINEPWDSPHNLALLEFMPEIYRSIDDLAQSATTRVKYFVGEGAPFPTQGTGGLSGPTFSEIEDGIYHTFAFVESGPSAAVPWTKPADSQFHANNPYSVLGELGASFSAAFLDAYVNTFPTSLSVSQLDAYITHNGGEDINNPPPVTTVPGFYVLQSGGDTVTNEFGADSFDVVLDLAPASNVVIDVNVSDASVATLDRTRLTFAPGNWNVPQRVAVQGVDNHVLNPDRVIKITVSIVDALSANAYDPVPNQVFAATIRDDDQLPGDFDRNSTVDAQDLGIWRAAYGQTNAADADGDGDSDGIDFLAWQRNRLPTIGTATLRAELVDAALALDLLQVESDEIDLLEPEPDAGFVDVGNSSPLPSFALRPTYSSGTRQFAPSPTSDAGDLEEQDLTDGLSKREFDLL